MQTKEIKQLLEVFLTLQVTKELPRQGFIYSGFKRNEADSVAAHSFNVAAFSYLLARELKSQGIEGIEVNPEKTLKIAVLHDMGESITGDIGTWVKVLAEGKFEEVENKAFKLLVRNLSNKEELVNLFKEYNKLETIEAQIVKLADALDAIAQGINTPGARLEDWKLADKKIIKNKIKNEKLRKIFDESINLLFNRKVTYFRGHINND
ncbi:HD family hydrolase [Candidatus Woesearchaeota archaeon]|nr:HD family hydrolase [Candidatus Woesearchaeota archaeon]